MRIWYASIFLSLLAGKFSQFEQSAGVTQFMEIFRRSKNQITQRQQTLNQRMCKRLKVRLSIFSTLTVDTKNINLAHVQKAQSETSFF